MTKGNVTVLVLEDGQTEEVDTPAYIIGNLAVHRQVDELPLRDKWWVVTEPTTGRRLCMCAYFEDAKRMARDINGLGLDWSQIEESEAVSWEGYHYMRHPREHELKSLFRTALYSGMHISS